MVFPENNWDGHFAVCKNCQKAFDASWYNERLRNIVKLAERTGEDEATLYVQIQVACPHCLHKDTYIGGDENKWQEIYFTNSPKVKEEVYEAEAEALRTKVWEVQRENITLGEQLRDLRREVKQLKREGKRLADMAYLRMSHTQRRGLK